MNNIMNNNMYEMKIMNKMKVMKSNNIMKMIIM